MPFFAYTSVQWTEYSCVRSILAYGLSNNYVTIEVHAILCFEASCAILLTNHNVFKK